MNLQGECHDIGLAHGLHMFASIQISSGDDGNGNPANMQLHFFLDSDSDFATATYETECGKFGKSEIVDSGYVGLRMTPLVITVSDAAFLPMESRLPL